MKQLVILVCYMQITDSISLVKAKRQISETWAIFEKIFDEQTQIDTNTIIKIIVIPVKNQPTKIECIFPTAEDLPENIIEKLEDIESNQNKLYS